MLICTLEIVRVRTSHLKHTDVGVLSLLLLIRVLSLMRNGKLLCTVCRCLFLIWSEEEGSCGKSERRNYFGRIDSDGKIVNIYVNY